MASKIGRKVKLCMQGLEVRMGIFEHSQEYRRKKRSKFSENGLANLSERYQSYRFRGCCLLFELFYLY